MLLALIAYWVREWRLLTACTIVLPTLSLFMYSVIDESPRFLLAKGRVEEATTVLQRMAAANAKGSIPAELLQETELDNETADFTQMRDGPEEPASCTQLFIPPLLRRMLVMLLVWCSLDVDTC